MHCPNCGDLNFPGSESCRNCQQPLTSFDMQVPHDRIEHHLANDPVSKLKPTLPVTVPATANLGKVMQTMIAASVGAVLVVDDDSGLLIGIVTERDFLTRVAGQPGLAELPVRDFMTPNPETVLGTDTVAAALGKMDVRGYRHLPVVEAGLPVGMISVRDILRYMTSLFPQKDRG